MNLTTNTFRKFEDFMEVLEQSSQLEHCSINIGYMLDLNLSATLPMLSLIPKLSVLEITMLSSIIRFMDHFTFPLLYTLSIKFCWNEVRHPDIDANFEHNTMWPHEELSSFIFRLLCHISTIHLKLAPLMVS